MFWSPVFWGSIHFRKLNEWQTMKSSALEKRRLCLRIGFFYSQTISSLKIITKEILLRQINSTMWRAFCWKSFEKQVKQILFTCVSGNRVFQQRSPYHTLGQFWELTDGEFTLCEGPDIILIWKKPPWPYITVLSRACPQRCTCLKLTSFGVDRNTLKAHWDCHMLDRWLTAIAELVK